MANYLKKMRKTTYYLLFLPSKHYGTKFNDSETLWTLGEFQS
jgi:hypothetical protein